MTEPETTLPTTIAFATGGLLSKWGFGDGDCLDDFLDDNGFGDVWSQERGKIPDEAFGFDHRVLIRVVEAYVLPAVREHHDIEIFRVHTIHNPIRASKLDGEDVDNYGDWQDLTPPSVEVPAEAILAIAREERGSYAE